MTDAKSGKVSRVLPFAPKVSCFVSFAPSSTRGVPLWLGGYSMTLSFDMTDELATLDNGMIVLALVDEGIESVGEDDELVEEPLLLLDERRRQSPGTFSLFSY